MYNETDIPDLLYFPFSNRWLDIFGLGITPDLVLRPDGIWVPVPVDGAPVTLWRWDGSQFSVVALPPQDGAPSANDAVVGTGSPIPIADPHPVNHAPVELTGVSVTDDGGGYGP